MTQQAVGLCENVQMAQHGEAVKTLAHVYTVPADDFLGLDKGSYANIEQRVERMGVKSWPNR